MEKCPLHAWNEQKMAIRSSIQNKTRSKKREQIPVINVYQ